MPFCWQYYVNPYDGPANGYKPPNETGHTLALKPDTPAKWRAMCTSTLSQASLTGDKGDFFRLRSVSAQVPLDFAVPDRVSNAVLTVSLNNSWGWQPGNTAIRDPDMGAVDGLVEGPGTTVIPTPVTFNASVRVQF
jgi:hypothetical protein